MYQAIVFLPLIGAIFAGFFGWLVPARASEVITTSLVLITALLSWFAFYQVGIEGHEARIELLRPFVITVCACRRACIDIDDRLQNFRRDSGVVVGTEVH